MAVNNKLHDFVMDVLLVYGIPTPTRNVLVKHPKKVIQLIVECRRLIADIKPNTILHSGYIKSKSRWINENLHNQELVDCVPIINKIIADSKNAFIDLDLVMSKWGFTELPIESVTMVLSKESIDGFTRVA
jgi:hypothetical protein